MNPARLRVTGGRGASRLHRRHLLANLVEWAQVPLYTVTQGDLLKEIALGQSIQHRGHTQSEKRPQRPPQGIRHCLRKYVQPARTQWSVGHGGTTTHLRFVASLSSRQAPDAGGTRPGEMERLMTQIRSHRRIHLPHCSTIL